MLPIILVLTFAVIDWAFYFRDSSGAANIVRDAARKASTLPRTGAGLFFGHDGEDTPPAEPSFAFQATQVIANSGLLLPEESIVELGIFEADAAGFPIGSGGALTCPQATCVLYGWNPDPAGDGSLPGEFLYSGGSTWDPKDINACAGDPDADAVGAYIKVRHTSIFGLTPTGIITERAVLAFEPLPNRPGDDVFCKPQP